LNFTEGTRRLALLLGVFGAILGGFVSHVELQTTLEQRARHTRFEQLGGSDVVQQERKCRLDGILSAFSDNPADSKVKDPKTGVVIDWSEAQPLFPKAPYSDPNRGGIKEIVWTKDFGVKYFESEDGQTLYPTPAPSAWEYLLIALFPSLDFSSRGARFALSYGWELVSSNRQIRRKTATPAESPGFIIARCGQHTQNPT
jgi:hypothetical protein